MTNIFGQPGKLVLLSETNGSICVECTSSRAANVRSIMVVFPI